MGGYFVQKGYYQQQDTNNNKMPVIAGMQATVENAHNSTSKAVVLATALTKQKQGCIQQHANNIRDPQHLGQGIPATTGTHKDLRIFSNCRILSDSDSPTNP